MIDVILRIPTDLLQMYEREDNEEPKKLGVNNSHMSQDL